MAVNLQIIILFVNYSIPHLTYFVLTNFLKQLKACHLVLFETTDEMSLLHFLVYFAA